VAPLPPQLVTGFPYYPIFGNTAQLATEADEQIIIINDSGQVVFDTDVQLAVSQPLPPELAPYGVPLTLDDQEVGQLLYPSTFFQELLRTARRTLRRTLLLSGVVAAMSAIALSLYLADRLAQPVRRLSEAARQYTHGRHSQPLPVESADEMGLLTQTFNEMTTALERQKQLRTQMVADIAHELRTPLSAMKLEVEGMVDGLQSPQEASVLLHEEIERLQRLVEDLRQLSLADAGAVSLEMELMPLLPLLRQAATLWQTQAEKTGVRMVADLPAGLPTIYGDRDRLAQVLTNLLSNAMRYTPPGGVITLAARQQDDEVSFWVQDSGFGLDETDLSNVFKRSYRGDRSRSRETGGSGLELAIARQWVLLHGGAIQAENNPDAGARFTVTLPLAGNSG
jgi:signal transduction histidine kinase